MPYFALHINVILDKAKVTAFVACKYCIGHEIEKYEEPRILYPMFDNLYLFVVISQEAQINNLILDTRYCTHICKSITCMCSASIGEGK